MSHINDIIQTIPKLHSKTGCSTEQIAAAEEKLRLHFSNEFIDYLLEYGTISFYGTEWNGLNTASYRNVVNATLEARQLHPKFPNHMYIVENLHIDGILIVSDSKGCIYEWYNEKLHKLYPTLTKYLESCIARKLK